jgi:alkylhydroperoxidase family enzyme
MPRIAAADEPYPPEIATALARTMPPGVAPLVLFRTMARNPRVFGKMFAGGLLDRGQLSLRQREVVIDRTTARLGAEYEWGVHIAATVHGPADASCWSADERALLAAVDDLVDRRTIGDETWTRLAAHFDEAQILEVIALAGYYHTISFLCRALDLPLEAYGARFPEPPLLG